MRRAALCLVACVVATPGLARAQAGTVQEQFDYGLKEMQAGRYATGCPALAESYRLDPHPGVLFTLAECENRWGKIASALTHYDAYLDLFAHMSEAQKALQRGRDKVSTTERDRLRPQVPELALALPAMAPAGTTITRDGALVAAPSLGVPLPVDPGEHVIAAKTPDGLTHETRISLSPGEHRAMVVDITAPPPAPSLQPPLATPPAPPSAPLPETPAPRAGHSRTPAWLVGAVGVAGLAVGAVAGVVVLGDKSTIDAQCAPDRSCSQAGLNAAREARTWGLVSDVGFAVGAAGIVTAAVLFLTASPPPATRSSTRPSWRPSASVQPHGGFVGLRATW